MAYHLISREQKTKYMALKNIESVKEMESLLSSNSRNYVLLYKKGSEQKLKLKIKI